MIEFKRANEEDLSVNMYVDGKFIGVFPTEKRGRMFFDGLRDKDGNKLKAPFSQPAVEEASITSGANQKIGEPKKKLGRPKKVGKDDGRKSL